MSNLINLKAQILSLVEEYASLAHSSHNIPGDPRNDSWTPGDPVPYAARTFDEKEVVAAVDASLDFWLTLGMNGKAFENQLENYLGVKKSILVNSGSSANLLAISSLTSPKIPIKKRLLEGDEVITVAAGFPTTVAPIIQNRCIPVFVDACPITANALTENLRNAFTPGKTKAVFMAHALGNPFNISEVLSFCRSNDLWLIEDNCDSLGSTYSMPSALANSLGIYESSPSLSCGPDLITRYTGTWGDISTQSYYPPHHMTMGEGGSVNIISNPMLYRIVESMRDWGRDCWCPSGQDNSCNKRYDWSLGELPNGYDHKYIYSHFGYNLKPLDIQAAIGLQQLEKLPQFIRLRMDNWNYLRQHLDKFTAYFDFSLPTHATSWNTNSTFDWDTTGCTTECSWFGFKIGIKPSATFTRSDFARYLQKKNIGSRMFFGGNLLKQPCFVDLKNQNPMSYRVVGNLDGANDIMSNQIFLGTYPGLSKQMLDYQIRCIEEFIHSS